MGFSSLTPQLPIFPPEAEDYSQRALALSETAASLCETLFDIPYGTDERQKLDMYLPRARNPTRSLPVLVFMHGGGWTNGYKEWFGLLAPAITSFPAIFVSVSCRLAPVNRFPVPFEDAIRALGWVYRNVAGFGGDRERVFVGGHSSGGHLAALATLRPDQLAEQDIPPTFIKACLPVSARFDMVFVNPLPGSIEFRHREMLFEIGQDPTPASPLHNIRSCGIPFLITYGSEDMPSIIENGEKMLTALQSAGTPVECLVLDGRDHFDTAIDIREPAGSWMSRVRRIVHETGLDSRAR